MDRAPRASPTGRASSPRPAPGLSILILAVTLVASTGCRPDGGVPEPDGPEGDAGRASAAPPETPTADHAAEVRTWQRDREASLREPGSWLSLVGLFWLEEGTSSFGSAEENRLVFPDPAPERAGTFHRSDGSVRVEAAEGADLRRVAGADPTDPPGPEVDRLELLPDTAGGPTVLALGSLRFWVIERGGRLGVRVSDLESPALEGFPGLDFFPVAPEWRIEARLERRPGATVAMPNVLGQVQDLRSPGTLVFEAPASVGGGELRLVPTQGAPGEPLFLVFADATNGRTTYGGGRFLYADPPAPDDPEGRVVLDFNRAYNPPCAFTAFATCPLPPEPNELEVAVEAGERRFAGEVPH